ncbi:MAG: AgmX/PglI C-terminal domain-containing protein [Alphaproteobacteria bacterium]|nr:AgmX/PglI C-terminal domain-containing protein [Alphaproteobacteria bacterium]
MTKQPQIRVLRIGVAYRGKIVAEQLVRQGRAVSIGTAPDCTVQVEDPSAPRRHELFTPRKDGLYTLALPPDASGRVASADGPRTLGEPGGAPLELGETDRGKIRIGETTVLFQFVAPPPELMAGHRGDFRPRLIEDDDPVFLSFLGLFTAGAAAFLVLVATTPVRESVPLDELPDRIVELAFTPPEVEPPDPDPVDEPEPELAEREDGEPVPMEAEPEPQPSDDPSEPGLGSETPTERSDRIRDEVERRSLMLAMLVNVGEGDPNNRLNGVFGQGDAMAGDLDEALRHVNGVDISGREAFDLKQDPLQRRLDADIGELKGVTSSNATVSKGPATEVRGSVDAPEGQAELPEGMAGDILGVIRKNSGQVRACYERELRLDPTLQGRVEVMWSMVSGRVRSASIFSNSTGNKALGDCIVSKVRLWRFDPEASGDVIMPYILSPQN